jgi:general secretion pathway protein J
MAAVSIHYPGIGDERSSPACRRARSACHADGARVCAAGACGFTLIELLVALAVFSIVSLLAVRGLGAAVDHRDHLRIENSRWRSLAALFATMESDLAAVLPSAVGPAGAQLSFSGGAGSEAPGAAVTMLRSSASADNAQPALPRWIEYRANAGAVERTTRRALPAATESPLARQRYQAGIARLEIAYLDADGAWRRQWPARPELVSLPRAARFTLDFADGSRVTRIFLVAGG